MATAWKCCAACAKLLGIRKQLRERLMLRRPDVFIGVDAPDFNLGLEARPARCRHQTVHFVSPSIWAWRAEARGENPASADHVLCIFPSSRRCWRSTALRRPTWGIRWPA
jgi:lipid-A-disaccharide synthase